MSRGSVIPFVNLLFVTLKDLFKENAVFLWKPRSGQILNMDGPSHRNNKQTYRWINGMIFMLKYADKGV